MSQTVDVGLSAGFTVEASGIQPFAYQWRFNGGNIPGANTNTYAIAAVQFTNVGDYTVVVTNSYGSVTSTVARLSPPAPPIVTIQPTNQSAFIGHLAAFSVTAFGPDPLSYQWRFNETAMPGASNDTLTITSAQATNEGAYTVVITNAYGSVTSEVATLTVLIPPTILTQPASQNKLIGQSAAFTVTATGPQPIAYQWRKEGVPLAGATTASLALTNVQGPDAGHYDVVVSNVSCGVTSLVAVLTVNLALADSFNPQANSVVYALAIQPDGKILVGGYFSTLGGQARNHLGRLNTDGTLDTTFDPGANGVVYAMAIQPDGRILVGGSFTTLAGQPRNRIGRLNPDGSLDTSFDPGANDTVHCIVALAEDKILVGGYFTTLGGQTRNYIGQLNADATLDTNYNSGANAVVYSMAIQPDAKILVGGGFTTLGGRACNYIGRLNADATLDTNYNSGANGGVYALAAQADGKVLAGGAFTTLGGQSHRYLGRLNADGTLDASFTSEAGNTVYCLGVQTDGKILAGGSFSALGGQSRSYLGRLNGDGTIDVNFNPEASSTVLSLAVQPDGKILVGGYFGSLGGQYRSCMGRLNNTGPATQRLALDGSTITWLRGGMSPEVWRAAFDCSTNLADWVSLGDGQRIPGGWELAGVSLPPHGEVRARGFVAGGYFSGSGWFVETVIGPPTIVTQPANQTVLPGQEATFSVVAAGADPLSYQWRFNGTDIPGATTSICTFSSAQNTNGGSYAVVVTNAYGSVTSSVALLNVLCVTPPILTCAPNKTVEYGTAWGFDPPTGWDLCCGTNLSVMVQSTVTNGTCPRYIARVWQAIDCASNVSTCTQTVTVVATQPLTLICAPNKTVEYGSAWVFDPPTALDLCCDTNLSLTVQDTVTNGTCPGVIARTWQAIDCNSNTATCTQTITLVDTQPPTLTCASNKAVVAGSAWDFDPPAAWDLCCGTNLSVTVRSTSTNGSCPRLIARIWQAIDCNSNVATCTQTVTEVDIQAPTLTCATNKTVACGSQWTFDRPSASDLSCGTNVTVWLASSNLLWAAASGVAVWQGTWHAADACGNISTCVQTVTLVDRIPPTITGCTNITAISTGTNGAQVFFTPTALDNCDPAPVINCVPSSGSYFTPGTNFVWCTATDASGNANSCTFQVRVIDPIEPVLRITQQGTNASLFWPQTSSRYALEENTVLGSSAWFTNDAPVETVGSEFRVTVAAGIGSRFFRLRAASPFTTNGVEVFMVGTNGGTIRAASGNVTLQIPPGALSAEVGISIRPVAAGSGIPALIPGPAYDFSPDGLTFAVPAILTLHYDPSQLPAGADESAQTLFTLKNGAWSPLFIGSLDPGAKTLTAPVQHFSLYGIGWYAAHPDECYDYLEEELNSIDTACCSTTDLRVKTCRAKRVAELQIIVDHLSYLPGLQDLAMHESYICGGLLDDLVPWVDVQPTNITLMIGESTNLTAVPKVGDQVVTGTKEIFWRSDYPGVATVANGVVTAVSKGKTRISAYTEPAEGSCKNFLLQGWVEVWVTNEPVDIVFVAETESGSWDWMGFDDLVPYPGPDLGLNDYAPQVVSALGAHFDSYRFGFVGFGQYPSMSSCDGDWEEFRPFVPPTPFYDWFGLTADPSTIADGLTNFRLICSFPPPDWYDQGTTLYSALLHAVRDSAWRPGARKVIIAFSTIGVRWWYTSIDSEMVTGYTKETVINAANSAGVTIFILDASRHERYWAAAFNAIADGTGGQCIVAPWPMINSLETAFDGISAWMSTPSPAQRSVPAGAQKANSSK